ncbi:MAG TPA: ATP-binding cassette domain-containing protein [Pseudomonadales bacterium]|nr:ATP-binding cassette domain-containing protein [Pseudomonadales bacterium]
MDKIALSLDGVGFSYNERALFAKDANTVLDGVSFQIMRGEVLGVIGKNGSGKSTLMKIVAGIVKPDAGKLVSKVDKIQLLSLQVGFIQELTGRENVILSSLLLGMRRKAIEQQMDQVIAFSELGAFIDKPLNTYSSGMRARLGFSVACQADPDVLLIDEAFSVGDASFRKKSKAIIEERMQTERSFVLVSHSESMLREYCARCVWLDQGRVMMVDETERVLNAYGAN